MENQMENLVNELKELNRENETALEIIELIEEN